MFFSKGNFKKLIIGIMLTLGISSYGLAQYCESSASNNNPDFEYINSVVVGDINNQSSSKLYSDYTASISTDMYVGESYNITITNSKHDPVDQMACWVDWNKDEVFDANERITLTYNGVNSKESDATGVIVPPTDAVIGATRMRVMLIADITPDPCASFTYGEVEDYSINVVAISEAPKVNIDADRKEIFTGEAVNFTDLSSMVPTSWNWSISPATVTFIESTDANTQNPVVTFNEPGTYSITLQATNNIGTGDSTFTNYIEVKPFSKPKFLAGATEGKHVDLQWSAPNVAGAQSYVQVENAIYSTSALPERAVRFTSEDLNFSFPVTVTALSAYFFENLYSPWKNDYFKFKVYDSDTTTLLYESGQILALNGPEVIHTLETPLSFEKEFYVSVEALGAEDGSPASLAMELKPHKTHTYVGKPGEWMHFTNEELSLEVATSIYIQGDKSSNGIKVNHFGDYDFDLTKSKSDENVVYQLKGYKIYRDGVFVDEINDPLIKNYREENLANGTYTYTVSATYTPQGESPQSEGVDVTVDNSAQEIILLFGDKELSNGDEIKLGHNVMVDSTELIEFEIQNEGVANLEIDSIVLDNSDFKFVEAIPTNISGESSTSFKLEFKPTSEGPKSVNIKVYSSDDNESLISVKLNVVAGLDKWTWMLYLLEDDQGLDGLKDINEWEVNGSVEGQVNYIVLYNANVDANDGIWYVKKDENGYNKTLVSELVSTHFGTDPDLGDPKVLEEFILWVKDNYPAQHYGLTMWDHGSGIFKKSDKSPSTTKGFVDEMKLWEMSDVLETFKEESKSKIDVVGFDVCLLGAFETAYQLRDLADYVIASQLTEPGDGWDYTAGFAHMTENPNITPEDIAINITNTFVESYQIGGSQGRSASTQAATSIAVLNQEFIPVFNELSERLAEVVYDYKQEITLAMNNAWSTVSIPDGLETDPDNRDLGGFLENLSESSSLPTYITSKAAEALVIYKKMVVANGHTEDAYTDGSTGLKIWMPQRISRQGYLKEYYTDSESYLDISLTKWDEFLYAYETPTNTVAPVAEFSAPAKAELGVSTQLTNKSYGGPTSFEWTITPGTYEYASGSSATSKNPIVKFTELGAYTISLKAINSIGNNSSTQEECIEIINPVLEAPENLTAKTENNNVILSWAAPSSSPLLYQDFEELASYPPAGWELHSNDNLQGDNLDGLSDSTNTWGLCDENTFKDQNGNPDPQYIKEGVYSVAIGYTAGSTGDPYNWLITPEVTVRTGDALSFWMWYVSDESYYTDFDVLIYADQTWTSLMHLTSGSSKNLYDNQIVLSLSDYIGKTVKVAFVYQYTDGYQMAIDNILIGEEPQNAKTAPKTHVNPQRKEMSVSTKSTTKGGHVLAAYNIYRDGNKISTVTDLTKNSFTDSNVENGTYSYYITKVYSEPEGESEPSNTVTVDVIGNAIGDILESKFKVYPNPAQDVVSVETYDLDAQEIRIIDAAGAIRKMQYVSSSNNTISVDDLNSGMYTLQVVTNNRTYNTKLIIN